jgi:hypothetical protein
MPHIRQDRKVLDGNKQTANLAGLAATLCHGAGVASIIEPINRKPRDESPWDWNDGALSGCA